MPTNLSAAEFYRREADRLRNMAGSPAFHDVREGLLRMADEYDVLAAQRAGLTRHSFGRPLERPLEADDHPPVGARGEAAEPLRRTA